MITGCQGPFTFAEYVQHLLTDGTWGDDHVLTLVSLLWQVKITILNAATLGGDKDQAQ